MKLQKIIKIFQTKKKRPRFNQTFKEELMLTLLKSLCKIGSEGTLPNSFNETTIILIHKPYKDLAKKENYKEFCLMNTDSNILNEILINWIQEHI